MAKLRKQRIRKKFRYNINRKRLRNKINNPGVIPCKEIKTAWDTKKSLLVNMSDMGLCYNPNEAIKTGIHEKTKNINDDWHVEDVQSVNNVNSKNYVVNALIQDAKAPRERKFKLPKAQIDYLTYMINKHGLDYKAMEMDKKNYNQDTWKQLRSKVKQFQSIPEQYNIFLSNASSTVLHNIKHGKVINDDQ